MISIKHRKLQVWLILSAISIFNSQQSIAGVDKIYHPYVEQNTYEFESRFISQLDSDLTADFSVYRFGFGKDVSEKLFLEIYLIGAKISEKNIEVEAYELEALYQLTEQGEYWLDVGFLFEIERERNTKEWEGNIALLLEKEFGRWSASLNLHNQYEFEDDKKHEWEFSHSFQLRYRYSASFEPGLEVYSDQNAVFVGPVFMGSVLFGLRKINWEFGVDRSVNQSENETVLRGLIEYEF